MVNTFRQDGEEVTLPLPTNNARLDLVPTLFNDTYEEKKIHRLVSKYNAVRFAGVYTYMVYLVYQTYQTGCGKLNVQQGIVALLTDSRRISSLLTTLAPGRRYSTSLNWSP